MVVVTPPAGTAAALESTNNNGNGIVIVIVLDREGHDLEGLSQNGHGLVGQGREEQATTGGRGRDECNNREGSKYHQNQMQDLSRPQPPKQHPLHLRRR